MDRASIKARQGVSSLTAPWAVFSLVFAALATRREAAAQCNYEVTAIIQAPECPFGPPPTIATGISELGHVVGYYQQCAIGHEAFLWTPQSGLTTLDRPPDTPSAEASDLNDIGGIIGTIDPPGPSGQHGFVWENGTWTMLLPDNDGLFSGAYAINNLGQVVGYRDIDAFTRNAFLWDNGLFTTIPPSFGARSLATDVNDAGDVVGWMGTSNGIDSHAFVWNDGVMMDLGLIPGSFAAQAQAINSARAILITASLQKDESSPVLSRSFLCQDGNMTDLGVLAGFDRCSGFDLNDAFSVVGVCSKSSNPNFRRAFIWRDGAMMDLNNLIPAESGLNITWVRGINNRGQITGQAQDLTGHVVGVVLAPTGRPIGDINADGVVNVPDLIALLHCFAEAAVPGCESEDVNADGVVNVLDLIDLLLAFGTTCP